MKRWVKFLLLFLVFKAGLAQNAGIGETGFIAHPSSILEVRSSNKGLLIPRISLMQTTSSSPVANPAVSLLVYNTATINDVTPGFYFWDGTKWVRLLTGAVSDAWALQGNSIAGTEFLGTTNNQPFRIFTNNQERVRVTPQGIIGVGTTVPHSTAIVEMQSTQQGILVPRMTTAQRNAIANPADVLLIFNTTTRCFEWWDATNNVWISFACSP